MADIIEDQGTRVMKDFREIPSNGKTNAALTLGIIGTAMSVLGTGVVGALSTGTGRNGRSSGCNSDIENKEWRDYLELTKQYYHGRMVEDGKIADLNFDSYKRDVDNSFILYKSQRDANDAMLAKVNYDEATINAKIAELDKKIDIINAVQPYQQALINNSIEMSALREEFNLQKATSKMINGELVLPSTPTVTGYPSSQTAFRNLITT